VSLDIAGLTKAAVNFVVALDAVLGGVANGVERQAIAVGLTREAEQRWLSTRRIFVGTTPFTETASSTSGQGSDVPAETADFRLAPSAAFAGGSRLACAARGARIAPRACVPACADQAVVWQKIELCPTAAGRYAQRAKHRRERNAADGIGGQTPHLT
jgi:hypothetical protein